MFFSKISKIVPYAVSLIAPLLLTALLCVCAFIGENAVKNTVLTDTKPENSVSDTIKEPETNNESDSESKSETENEVTPETEVPPVQKNLVITSPESNDTTVTSPTVTFTGTCKTDSPLYINGEEYSYDENGYFSHSFNLKHGANTFKFEHKGETASYTVRYRYIVISSYDPAVSKSVEGGSVLYVNAVARKGGTVTATFNGETKTMTAGNETTDGFCNYTTSFNIPAAQSKDVNLGKVTFKGTHNGISETFYSNNIVCKKVYIPQIAEVTVYAAETFNGGSRDNWTRPTNNYLPEGTVDYVIGSFTERDGSYVNTFLELKCGRRIYQTLITTPGKVKVPAAKIYEGYLPDHNELSVAEIKQSEKNTILKFNCDWKAPFFLDLLPQSYTNPKYQDYTISSFTAQYVEIKFCYATVFEGTVDIPSDNPLFSSAEVFPSGDSTVLRLYLKKTGAFYGWDCWYNGYGQLVFEFKHPVGAIAGNNEYGADLTGITILVDAGHGGSDPGAASGNCVEKARNLFLAGLIETELKKMGATVIMSRTSDTTLNSLNRVEYYRSIKPDFMVSVHHDSNTVSSLNGFGSYYTTPFSHSAAKFVFDSTIASNVYNNSSKYTKLDWHHFYMTRVTYCPSVLTENGYISNYNDRVNIMNDAVNQTKAKAIAQGIANYFLSVK